MANTITFEIEESKLKKLGKLIDKVLESINRIESKGLQRDADMKQMSAEINAQKIEAGNYLAIIAQIDARMSGKKMIWEKQ